MKFKFKKRPQSALGLSLGDGQLRAVLVARARGGWEAGKSASAALTLDLLHPEPELIGREIRNHLDAAGIHERTCVVAVPPKWVMSMHTKLPELAPEDVDSFLQLEAEKGFPCDVAQLQIARSFHRSAAAAYVTQLAVRKDQLDQLAAALKAAGLKPVSFTLGLAALPGVIPQAGGGRITVALEPQGAAVVIAGGGGIAAFRTSEASIESEAGEKVVNGGAVARELRITFEQLPEDLRAGLRRLHICGDEALGRQLAERVGEWAGAAGLAIEREDPPGEHGADQVAQAVATQWLEPTGSWIEFLPERPGRWQVLMARYNSKRLATVGMAVGALAVVVLAVFGWQEFRLISLRSEWASIQTQVTALGAVQDQIRDYRPWYNRSFPDLQILMRVTECFPQNGSVTAKTFEVHQEASATTVSVGGTALELQALLRTQDQLRQAKEIRDVKVENISGKMPAQFTLTFRWIGNSGS